MKWHTVHLPSEQVYLRAQYVGEALSRVERCMFRNKANVNACQVVGEALLPSEQVYLRAQYVGEALSRAVRCIFRNKADVGCGRCVCASACQAVGEALLASE